MSVNAYLFRLFLFVMMILSSSFARITRPGEKIDDIYKTVSIRQNGAEYLLNPNENTLQLQRKKFSILFYNKAYNEYRGEFHAAQLVVFSQKEPWNEVREGKSIDNLPCLEPGTGMAPDESGQYETLIINAFGHHYLYYENEVNKRVKWAGRWKNYIKLQLDVNKILVDESEQKIEETTFQVLYLALFIDRNLNAKIDKDELTKMELKF